MNSGSRVATAIGAGYLLGRTRKLRLAVMLAAAGVTGALEVRTRALLRKGSELLASSDELEKLTALRDDVVDSAKAAAIMAATRRIEALSKHIAPPVDAKAGTKAVDAVERVRPARAEK